MTQARDLRQYRVVVAESAIPALLALAQGEARTARLQAIRALASVCFSEIEAHKRLVSLKGQAELNERMKPSFSFTCVILIMGLLFLLFSPLSWLLFRARDAAAAAGG